jgi:hypothetical protein
MVRFLVAIELHGIGYHLLFGDVFENQEFAVVLIAALRLV